MRESSLESAKETLCQTALALYEEGGLDAVRAMMRRVITNALEQAVKESVDARAFVNQTMMGPFSGPCLGACRTHAGTHAKK